MTNPSKKDSIETLDKVLTFNTAVIQAFGVLEAKCLALRSNIDLDPNDPISEDSIKRLKILMRDWENVTVELNKLSL